MNVKLLRAAAHIISGRGPAARLKKAAAPACKPAPCYWPSCGGTARECAALRPFPGTASGGQAGEGGQEAPAAPCKTPCNRLLYIEGGTFTMGSSAPEHGRWENEGPRRRVTVRPFYMSRYQVTQREWRDITGDAPACFRGDDLPVERVSWYDAVEYCNRRSLREGLRPVYEIQDRTVLWDRSAQAAPGTAGYRLPTEAEWEYACRAGTATPYYTGALVDGAGWYSGNSGSATHPVGRKEPNAWGLYDMHGNVWEWCWDWYGKYPRRAQTDPAGASAGSVRVVRGGGWFIGASFLRSAFRIADNPSARFHDLGFRLVRSAW